LRIQIPQAAVASHETLGFEVVENVVALVAAEPVATADQVTRAQRAVAQLGYYTNFLN
jgi:hypothetical protein